MVGLYENRQAVGGATDPQLHSNRTVIHFKREYLVQLYYTRGHRPGAPQNTWATADLAGARTWRPYGNDLYNGYRCSKSALLASFSYSCPQRRLILENLQHHMDFYKKTPYTIL